MSRPIFFNRDISWLSFNARVLAEAARPSVPLLERIRFLSIYSSNLDEFYRVRMPALLALQKIKKEEENSNTIYRQATSLINEQQQLFGNVFTQEIIPALEAQGYTLWYDNKPLPPGLKQKAGNYFFTQVAGLLQPVRLAGDVDFFPENNQLYIAVVLEEDNKESLALVNVPCNVLSRFLLLKEEDRDYILLLEDIIKDQLQVLFPHSIVKAACNIKITRDAELNLADEYEEDLAEKIEKQLQKRDFGYATRLLYEPGLPLRHLQHIIDLFHLHKASVVEGGRHHNLRDLAGIPISSGDIQYPAWPAITQPFTGMLFEAIAQKDRMVHAPYQSYDTVLRFFNEAAIDPSVEAISTTLYRVAGDSRIAQALISASRNGKKVTVLVELKARFDEANNIRWAKTMKANGIRIIYSSNSLKVHAKIALVKRKHATMPLLGLLATGNLNESTARFYTDHILLTAYQPMLSEMDNLFSFLAKRKRSGMQEVLLLEHLLIAQFNLLQRFLQLIQQEIDHAQKGLPARITIKMNNLEEEVLISKLYEASNAGVEVQLIVRGICRLVPGIEGQSENIKVRRIVDRYLEHGRIFIFHNNGDEKILLGSADWMNRNIYRRIEVCFPVYDPQLKKQLAAIINLQLQDNTQAVWIDAALSNAAVSNEAPPVRSQEAIYHYLQSIEQA